MALVLAGVCVAGPAAAQQADPSTPPEAASPADDTAGKLPVSLDEIRKGLEEAKQPSGQLKGLETPVHFKVAVEAKPKMPANVLAGTSKADYASPAVPGGTYAYELQQLLFPPTKDPLAQPYAAFSPGELLQVSITTLLEELLTPKVVQRVASARDAHDEQAAQAELAKALAAFCASKPDNGAGVFGCDPKASQ